MSKRLSPSSKRVSLRDALISAGLEPHLADLLDQMPQRVLQLDPRQPFRHEGDQANEVMFVRSGLVSKFRLDEAGGRRIVALRFAGEGIMPRKGPLLHGIEAIVRSEVLVGSAEDFQSIVDDHPEMQGFFARLVQRNENISYEWLTNSGRRSCICRVAHLICETAMRMGVQKARLQNPFTQQQIADITGQTSINVNRVLKDLERQGLIGRSRREISISDWDELRRVAKFDPGYLAI